MKRLCPGRGATGRDGPGGKAALLQTHPNAARSSSSTQTVFVTAGSRLGTSVRDPGSPAAGAVGGFGSAERCKKVLQMNFSQPVPSGGTRGATARLQRSQGCVGLISGPHAFARQRSGPKGSGIKNILLFTTVLRCMEGKCHGQMYGHTGDHGAFPDRLHAGDELIPPRRRWQSPRRQLGPCRAECRSAGCPFW